MTLRSRPFRRLASIRRLITPEQQAKLEEALSDGTIRLNVKQTGEDGSLRGGGAPPDEVLITSNDDDPFARPHKLEHRTKDDFRLNKKGHPVSLEGAHVRVHDDPVIYQLDDTSGAFIPYATNGWDGAHPNKRFDFDYQKEERFPLLGVQLGENGKPVKNDQGLFVWEPRHQYAGESTAFDALNAIYHSVTDWAGRTLNWGNKGQLEVNTHAFIGFNAFYDPVSLGLYFGLQPYQADGEDQERVFELASSWEVAAHEGGHALHDQLKPNRKILDQGFGQWSESFGDQLATYASLQHPERVQEILTETGGDLSKSNAASAMGEAFGALMGDDLPLRDAVNDKTVSNSGSELHDASETLTGAAYSVFVKIYDGLRAQGRSAEDAIGIAADTLGTFLVRAADFTPEDSMTLEDVAKAYLTVDQEIFGGQYQSILVAEFERRQLFSKPKSEGEGGSFQAWKERQASVPALTLSGEAKGEAIQALVDANLEPLGIGTAFGARVQSDETDATGQRIVRLELTYGRGADAEVIANHGSLVFRSDGTLADFHSAMPEGLSEQRAIQLLEQAHLTKWKRKGPLEFVRDEYGRWKVQVAVPVSEMGLGSHFKVYDLEHPQGYRVDFLDLRRSPRAKKPAPARRQRPSREHGPVPRRSS